MELSKIVTMSALKAFGIATLIYCCLALGGDGGKPKFRVIAFYTAKQDQAHISFVREAERWFPQMGAKYNFSFDTTSNWNNLNPDFLSRYQVVVFLDTRPEDPAQRAEAHIGHSPRRRSQASGDQEFARDLQVLAKRVVSVGEGSEAES